MARDIKKLGKTIKSRSGNILTYSFNSETGKWGYRNLDKIDDFDSIYSSVESYEYNYNNFSLSDDYFYEYDKKAEVLIENIEQVLDVAYDNGKLSETMFYSLQNEIERKIRVMSKDERNKWADDNYNHIQVFFRYKEEQDDSSYYARLQILCDSLGIDFDYYIYKSRDEEEILKTEQKIKEYQQLIDLHKEEVKSTLIGEKGRSYIRR